MLACWLAATVALIAAAGDLAAGGVAAPRLLLAVHLVALGFLPLAVTGGALHILPTVLRTDASRLRGLMALPLLCAGPLLAVAIAIAHELDWLALARRARRDGRLALLVGWAAGATLGHLGKLLSLSL